MKVALSLLGLLVVAGPLSAWEVPNLGKGELSKDLQDFVNLLPLDKIIEIVLQYAAEDAEFQNTLLYLQSKEFKDFVVEIESLPEVIELLNYVYDAGVDIYYLVNKINEFLGIPPLTPPQNFNIGVLKITGGLAGLEKDIRAVLPMEQLAKLYQEKLRTSPAFKELIDRLSSPQCQKIVDAVYVNPEFQKILQKAKAFGVDIEALWNLIHTLLGLKIPSVGVHRRF